ncbi:epoxide hydrolase aurD [Colletotrichum spaethianum]|uniref:Epoxide hydrolase aurD n=1 Tax=Colletotrichum spaethianum TaxID=700344 RepID=A0AA37P9P7_9PEZI|nr:epoxide hydrolase aurD [Colletotrichum spaethianum]GKT48214.1 epoxide hydrolase aurD [Colletotrichum spaethianum]
MARAMFTVVFISLFYFAKVAINDLAATNGLFDVIQEHLREEPIKFTSFKPLDGLLTMLVRFFQPIVAGKDPTLSLFCIFMIGQLMAIHVIIQAEGLRAGNRGKLISYTTFWGLAWQVFTIGVTLPVYFLVHIYTSPIPDALGPDAFAAAISIDPVQARALLGSLTIGAALPTLLAALPSPSVITPHTQEAFLAIWQAFPLWSGIAQFILSQAIGALGVVPKAQTPTARNRARDLRKIYTSTLPVVALTSYGVLAYVFWTSEWAPQPAIEFLKEMFVPPSPFSTAKMASVERGTLAFLQWDMWCASSATWSWILYMAYQRKGMGGLVTDFGKLVTWTTVLGPGGATLAVVWGRDVKSLRNVGGKKKTG